MKKSIYISALFFALVSGMVSCIPEAVEIEIPQAPVKLVVASQIIPENFIIVQVSRSFGALESTNDSSGSGVSDDLLERILADSARVTITYRDGTDTLTNLGAGLYFSNVTNLYEGETYTLAVFDSTSGESVISTATVLPIVPLQDAGYYLDVINYDPNLPQLTDTLTRFIVELNDPSGENFYMVNAYKISLGDTAPGSGLFTQNSLSPTVTFFDKQYPNTIIRDTFTFDQFAPGDTVALTLSNISKSYYEFLNTRQRSGESIFSLLLKEPITYPSNIEGGYGQFNLHLPSLALMIIQ